MAPEISIIVPCYNQAQYLDECLQSVLDQTYTNWECIIINDGSPDNTEEIAKRWVQKDKRFHYLYKNNGGVSSARNAGIAQAKGEWILPLDGDDKIGSNYLNLASKVFLENPHIIYCNSEYFGAKKGEMILEKFNTTTILLENQIFCSAFFKKTLWTQVEGYDEKMTVGYEDWEFWLRFIKLNSLQVVKLNYVGFYYRIKEVSRNIYATKDKDNLIRKYIFEKHPDLFFDKILTLEKYYKCSKNLKAENTKLKKILQSKRYRIINHIFTFFKR